MTLSGTIISMKTKREMPVENRVFTANDLRRIASVFAEEGARAAIDPPRVAGVLTIFEVTFADSTSLSSDRPDVLQEDILDGPARPVRISFTMSNYMEEGRHLHFRACQDSRYSTGELTVTGCRPWVSDVFGRLKDAIDAAKPQFSWPRRHQFLLNCFLAIGVASIVLLVFRIVIRLGMIGGQATATRPAEDASLPSQIMAVFSLLCLSFAATIGLTWWIRDLWPSVELDLGRPHLNYMRRRRVLLRLILGTIGASLLGNLAWALITWVV